MARSLAKLQAFRIESANEKVSNSAAIDKFPYTPVEDMCILRLIISRVIMTKFVDKMSSATSRL